MPQIQAEIVHAEELGVDGLTFTNEDLVTMDLAGMSGGRFLGVLRFGVFAGGRRENGRPNQAPRGRRPPRSVPATASPARQSCSA